MMDWMINFLLPRLLGRGVISRLETSLNPTVGSDINIIRYSRDQYQGNAGNLKEADNAISKLSELQHELALEHWLLLGAVYSTL